MARAKKSGFTRTEKDDMIVSQTEKGGERRPTIMMRAAAVPNFH